jgi:hypothetical protein
VSARAVPSGCTSLSAAVKSVSRADEAAQITSRTGPVTSSGWISGSDV